MKYDTLHIKAIDIQPLDRMLFTHVLVDIEEIILHSDMTADGLPIEAVQVVNRAGYRVIPAETIVRVMRPRLIESEPWLSTCGENGSESISERLSSIEADIQVVSAKNKILWRKFHRSQAKDQDGK